MFKIGKTYLTAANRPAKILWIESDSFCRLAGVATDRKLMTVLHEPYTANERVMFHTTDGVHYGNENESIDLLEIEYIQEFKN